MIIMGGSAKVNVPEGDGSAVDNNQEGSTDINNVNIPVVAGAFAAGNLFLSCFALLIMPSNFTPITISPLFRHSAYHVFSPFCC